MHLLACFVSIGSPIVDISKKLNHEILDFCVCVTFFLVTGFLVDYQFIIKLYNTGTARWKRCTGQGMWEGAQKFYALWACHSSWIFMCSPAQKHFSFPKVYIKCHAFSSKHRFPCILFPLCVLSPSAVLSAQPCPTMQEYWSGLPFPTPGDLPYPEIESRFSALQADSLPSEPQQLPSAIYF